MNKIFMLSSANIRKTKSYTISLILMFIIASLLLNMGLLIFLNFGSQFQKMTKRLNTSDVYYVIPNHFYSSRIDDYIKKTPNISAIQNEPSLIGAADILYKGKLKKLNVLFSDSDFKRTLSEWEFVGKHLELEDMSIYIPYAMAVDGGYKLKDKIKMAFKDTEIEFTVGGFIEDAILSLLDVNIIDFYLPHETYQRVAQKLGAKYYSTLIFANQVKKNKDVEMGINDLIKKDGLVSGIQDNQINNTVYSQDLKITKVIRTLMVSIIAVMMIVFSAIIAVVCLIVVRFRISNSIEDDMIRIGSLKAIGYISRQIILSILLQFSVISVTGSIAGIASSYLIIPFVSSAFAHQSGLNWVQGFDVKVSSISVCGILLIVILVSFLASLRINRLNPIAAFRGGIITHNFRRNHLPLHKSKGSLTVGLALKSILQNPRQSVMIGFITAFVSFASAFAVLLFYNSAIDTRTLKEMPGIEISDVLSVIKPDADDNKLLNGISGIKGVRKAQFIDISIVKADNYTVSAYVMDDFSKKETNTVYSGRYPLHSNEVVLAGYLAEMMQKRIGDSVTLGISDREAEFIITGLSQGHAQSGMEISLRHDGILKLYPDYWQQSLHLYLDRGAKPSDIINKLDRLYGNMIIKTVDNEKEIMEGMGKYTSIVAKVGMAIMIFTIIVVILVLYFVINSSIIRKKRDIGIQKAIGYTTLQLMNQLSLGFLPPILIGVLIGSLIGITQTNVLMSLAQHGTGIMKANYIIFEPLVISFGAAIVIVSYITSMIITYRIRKISAYALVTEI